MQNALEFYKDETGAYPIATGYTSFDINTQLIQNYLSTYIQPLKLPTYLNSISFVSKGSSILGYVPCPSSFNKTSKEYVIFFSFSNTYYCYGI